MIDGLGSKDIAVEWAGSIKLDFRQSKTKKLNDWGLIKKLSRIVFLDPPQSMDAKSTLSYSSDLHFLGIIL